MAHCPWPVPQTRTRLTILFVSIIYNLAIAKVYRCCIVKYLQQNIHIHTKVNFLSLWILFEKLSVVGSSPFWSRGHFKNLQFSRVCGSHPRHPITTRRAIHMTFTSEHDGWNFIRFQRNRPKLCLFVYYVLLKFLFGAGNSPIRREQKV